MKKTRAVFKLALSYGKNHIEGMKADTLIDCRKYNTFMVGFGTSSIYLALT